MKSTDRQSATISKIDRLIISLVPELTRVVLNRNWNRPVEAHHQSRKLPPSDVELATIYFIREWNEEYKVGLTHETIESIAIRSFTSDTPCHFHWRLKDWFDHWSTAGNECLAANASRKIIGKIIYASELVDRAWLLLEMDAQRNWKEAIGAYAILLDQTLKH